MPIKEKFLKEELIKKSCEYVKEFGVDKLNARNLAKYIGCSTQPLYRNYKNMEELKKDIKLEMHNNYEKFIEKYINKEDYLYTISYAYVMFAKKEPKTFSSLFMTELAGSRTVKEVVNSSWNIDTIIAMEKQYKISKKIAEEVYRDVRFYTHGIATQIACESVKLKEIEIQELIKNIIKIRLKN